MNINIELDLAAIISKAVSTERLQPLVEKAIGEALKSAIEDATGYRSVFRKAVEVQLAEAMPHGLAIDDVAKFQHVLNAALQAGVHGANSATVKTAMDKAVADVLPNVPTRIKLSELIEKARDDFSIESNEAFYAKLEINEYGIGHLYLDSDADTRSQYSAKIKLAFTKEGGVYALKHDGAQVLPSSLPKAISRFDGLMLALYVGRTSLELDIDEDEVESLACAKEDY